MPLAHIRLALSMYWRLLVALLVIGFLVLGLLLPPGSTASATLLLLKPSIYYLAAGAVLLASLLVSSKGLLYLVWGSRLSKPTAYWRTFTTWVAVLLFGLAAANLVVAYAASVAIWVWFKSVAPPVAVLVFSMLATVLSSRTAGSGRQHASPPEA